MSDLEAFAAHARKMATAQHKPECERRLPHRIWPTRPNPTCPGCVIPDDRALWTRLADEADAYLTKPEPEGLFT